MNPGVTPAVGTSDTTSYSSSGLSSSTTYYYKVAAVDGDGNIGPVSDQGSGTTATPPPPPADTTPPVKVTGLTVTPVSTSQLNLAWNKNPESDVTHYNVYRSTTNGFSVNPGVTPAVGTSSTTSYSSSGLSSSTTYYYKVAAVDGDGNIGPVSDQGSGTTATPPPPPADTTPPAVAITSPADNSIATSNIVTVTGTSTDSGGSGVKEVAVRIRAGTITPYTLATPTAPNDWSTWSVTVDLSICRLYWSLHS